MPQSAIELIRYGNRLIVNSQEPHVFDILRRVLTCIEVKPLYGAARVKAKRENKSLMMTVPIDMFTRDVKNRLVTTFGFYKRVTKQLKAHGYSVKYKNLTEYPRPDAFIADWDRLNSLNFELRYRQDEALQVIEKYINGRIDCPPGWGKSFVIGCAAILFPHAKIVVSTKSVDVMTQRLYPELAQMIPEVGLVGGGRKVPGHRIFCVTADSLHHAPADADFVFYDECHEAPVDSISAKLARFTHAHMWGFSASHDMRIDGKDVICEGLFGPVRLRVSYDEAVQHEMVVPLVVQWNNVMADYDPVAGIDDPIERKRLGIWQNETRNRVIAEDAKSYDANVQTLITVETIEHALHLKRLLPEFTLVYREMGIDEGDQRYFDKRGLLPPDFEVITASKRQELTQAFEQGELKKVIVTTVWNRGVNFRKLQVLIRGDGGASPINDVQIPGRTSRLHHDKSYGIVHDYKDQFNSRFAKRADKRATSYSQMGWEQLAPTQRSRLLEYLSGEISDK